MQHAYEQKPDVIYRDIATLRWPGYEIEGNGSIATVLKCCWKVFLCNFPLAAQVKRSEPCCTGCSHLASPDMRWHIIQLLTEPQQPTPLNIRNRALMERD